MTGTKFTASTQATPATVPSDYTDLHKRLRTHTRTDDDIVGQAADAIEALQIEVEALRATLASTLLRMEAVCADGRDWRTVFHAATRSKK